MSEENNANIDRLKDNSQFIAEFVAYKQTVNSLSNTLINWLYGLNTGGLFAIITLYATGRVTIKEMIAPTIFFVISLIGTIISTILDWQRLYNKLPEIERDKKIPSVFSQENRIDSAKIVRIPCYVLTILGIITIVISPLLAYGFSHCGQSILASNAFFILQS